MSLICSIGNTATQQIHLCFLVFIQGLKSCQMKGCVFSGVSHPVTIIKMDVSKFLFHPPSCRKTNSLPSAVPT